MNSLKRNLKCLRKKKFALYITFNTFMKTLFNPYHATGLLLYLLKTSGNQRFFDVFRLYKKRPVAWNGLMITRRSCITSNNASILWIFMVDIWHAQVHLYKWSESLSLEGPYPYVSLPYHLKLPVCFVRKFFLPQPINLHQSSTQRNIHMHSIHAHSNLIMVIDWYIL